MVSRRFLLGLAIAAFAHRADAAFRVDRTQLRAGGSIEITLELDGELARIHEIDLPVANLFLSEPSTSTEFSWVNGRTSRQRIFRWAATSRNVGVASVGPLTLTRNGTTRTFPRVVLQVLPAPAAPSTESQALDVLDEEQRIVLVAEVDSATAFRGQQRVVSWWLYTRNPIRSVRVTSRPSFRDFWVEEIPLDQEAEPEVAADGRTTRYLARRTALFPLRDGRLEVPPLGVTANLFERIEAQHDPFGVNRRIVEASATSQPIVLDVRPSPAAITGTMTLDCSLPRSSAAGPVVVTVVAKGDGNLRSAPTPGFEGSIDARTEWLDEGTKATSNGERVAMERNWRLTIFPRSFGVLEIPAITLASADASGKRAVLRCLATTVGVERALPTPSGSGQQRETPDAARPSSGWIVPAGVALLIASIAGFWFRGRASREREVRAVQHALGGNEPSALRSAVGDVLASQPASVRTDEDVRESFESFEALLELRIREPWREELELLVDEHREAFARAIVRARRAPRRSRS
jgi:hypothetical protein